MTATIAPTSFAPLASPVWDYLPAVAPYDLIAPTSANFGRSLRHPVRSIDVTSSFIDATTTLALSAAVAWLAATLRLQAGGQQMVFGALVDAMGARAAGAMRAQPSREVVFRSTTADEVRELRDDIQRESGLSRQEIALVVGVDRRSLSGWASGGQSPSGLHLDRLRALSEVTQRLNQLQVTELATSMRDAETAGSVTAAIRVCDVDRAVQAVLGPVVEEAPQAPLPPVLTPEQWTAIRRLVAAAELAAVEPDEVADGEPEPPARPLRVQLDRLAYATPRRPRRPTRGE
jgi:DNA-binding transcriptional regulator YiaG